MTPVSDSDSTKVRTSLLVLALGCAPQPTARQTRWESGERWEVMVICALSKIPWAIISLDVAQQRGAEPIQVTVGTARNGDDRFIGCLGWVTIH